MIAYFYTGIQYNCIHSVETGENCGLDGVDGIETMGGGVHSAQGGGNGPSVSHLRLPTAMTNLKSAVFAHFELLHL